MFNIKTKGSPKITYFRKLAIGAWKKPNNSTYYGKVKLNVGSLNTYLSKLNQSTPYKISINHAITKAMGIIFKAYPELNIALIRNKPKYRQNISAFFQTHLSSKQGYDLLGININNIEKKSLESIAKDVYQKAKQLRKKKDSQMEVAKKSISVFPIQFMGFAVKCFDFLMYTFNLNLSGLGFPSDRYGSFGISSIGSLGMEEAYIPLFPFSRCGMMIAIGKISQEPVIKNKDIIIEDTITITFTLDHRYYDGAHLSKPLRLLKKIINQPELYL